MHQLTRHIAGKFAHRNITANVRVPSLFASDMLIKDIEKKGLGQVAKRVPINRLGDELDMAGAAIYLSSRAGSFLTGAVLPVDGGMETTV